jgi:uncharacterized repeat protein (TIGR01451 family)
MHISKKYLLLLCSFLLLVSFSNATWEYVGARGSLSNGSLGGSATFDDGNNLYVAYNDGFDNRIYVKKYDGNNWSILGGTYISNYTASMPYLYVNNGTVYIAIKEYINSSWDFSVLKFNGTSWEYLGESGMLGMNPTGVSLYVYNNIPYISYNDPSDSYKLYVKKYEDSSWVSVGTAVSDGYASKNKLIVKNGVIYIAYYDDNSNASITVRKYENDSWVNIGNRKFYAGNGNFLDFDIDNNNVLYVATASTGSYPKANVFKYTGSDWVNVGAANFSNTIYSSGILLCLDNNIPYIGIVDYTARTMSVMQYRNGVWSFVGGQGFSQSAITISPSFFVKNNKVYVIYRDEGVTSSKGSVMKYTITYTNSYTFSESGNIANFIMEKEGIEKSRVIIDQTILGLNLTEANFSDVVMDITEAGKPSLTIPETNSIAATVNAANGSVAVTASFSGLPAQSNGKVPPIMMNGKQISDSNGNVFSDYTGYVRNISWVNSTGTLTFEILHFTEYGVPVLIGKTFAGTAASAALSANGSNIVVSYSSGSITGTVTQNRTVTVKKISGLAYETVLSDVPGTANNLYRPMVPGVTYNISFEYINRGNASDQIDLTTALTRTNDGHFTVGGNESKTVTAWQVASFNVEIDADNAYAYERATVDVTVDLNGVNAVSYNAFNDAYEGGTFASDGQYGGVDDLSYRFVLEAEGYSLTILSRSVTVNAPTGYTGTPVSETNLVPGVQITYFVAVKNNNNSVATSINLTDVIPNSCHLYYTTTPNVTGTTRWDWQGATDNAATNATNDAVKFEITIPALSTVTASYTVTLD